MPPNGRCSGTQRHGLNDRLSPKSRRSGVSNTCEGIVSVAILRKGESASSQVMPGSSIGILYGSTLNCTEKSNTASREASSSTIASRRQSFEGFFGTALCLTPLGVSAYFTALSPSREGTTLKYRIARG